MISQAMKSCTIAWLHHQCTVPICDWIWEKPPLTHKDKYLEIRNLIIQ